MSFDSLLLQLRPFFARLNQPVYLVGGAARDRLLGRECRDLDFVAPERAIKLAYQVGDFLGLPAYALDKERDTGRVVLPDGVTLDFARFRGDSLTADLLDRDFTINAIAIPVTADDQLIDPSGGQEDIRRRLIRQTNPQAIANDTVRALRAARQAADLNFDIHPDALAAMTAVAPRLSAASIERVRDELAKLMHGPQPELGLQALHATGIIAVLLPEIAALAPVAQSAPHHEPVLAHTFRLLRWLPLVEAAVVAQRATDSPTLQLAQTRLAAYAGELRAYLSRPRDGGWSNLDALRLAALFHDVGKAATQTVEADGRIRFLGHDDLGAKMTADRLRQLRFSNDLVQAAERIVAGHMRPLLFSATGAVSRRAAYRFFRAFGENGIGVALLSLADSLATADGVEGQEPPADEAWERLVGVVVKLCDTFFAQYEETVQPKPLIDGRQLMTALNLKAGPMVGRLLRQIEEAQAVGEIATAEEALALAQTLMMDDGQ
jgi:poly(A) polymerase